MGDSIQGGNRTLIRLLYQSYKLTTYYLRGKNSILALLVETRFIASESVIISLGIDCQECVLLGRRDKSRLLYIENYMLLECFSVLDAEKQCGITKPVASLGF